MHEENYYQDLLRVIEPYYDELKDIPESCRSNKLQEIADQIQSEYPIFDKDFIFYTLLENI